VTSIAVTNRAAIKTNRVAHATIKI
jgi:hypothetical protein